MVPSKFVAVALFAAVAIAIVHVESAPSSKDGEKSVGCFKGLGRKIAKVFKKVGKTKQNEMQPIPTSPPKEAHTSPAHTSRSIAPVTGRLPKRVHFDLDFSEPEYSRTHRIRQKSLSELIGEDETADEFMTHDSHGNEISPVADHVSESQPIDLDVPARAASEGTGLLGLVEPSGEKVLDAARSQGPAVAASEELVEEAKRDDEDKKDDHQSSSSSDDYEEDTKDDAKSAALPLQATDSDISTIYESALDFDDPEELVRWI